jgi:uncharacterized membrane protein
MQILLINVNPVVSRLFILCAREVNVKLDEVSRMSAVKDKQYDMVFVDESAYEQNISELLTGFKNIKKIFISYDSESMTGFDLTIEKPFLPSDIIELFESNTTNNMIETEEELEVIPRDTNTILEEIEEEIVEKTFPSIFPLASPEEVVQEENLLIDEDNSKILDMNEIEKIKNLLDMDDVEDVEDFLTEEEIEVRKVELIKKQLIDEGLEIVQEDEIVEELNLDSKKKSKKKKNKSKKLKFTKKNMERIEDAVEMAMANMTKKQMKKLLKGKEIEIKLLLKGKN